MSKSPFKTSDGAIPEVGQRLWCVASTKLDIFLATVTAGWQLKREHSDYESDPKSSHIFTFSYERNAIERLLSLLRRESSVLNEKIEQCESRRDLLRRTSFEPPIKAKPVSDGSPRFFSTISYMQP